MSRVIKPQIRSEGTILIDDLYYGPLLTLMNIPALWGMVGLPKEEFKALVIYASKNRIALKEIEKGDPLRLLEAATKFALEILDYSKEIAAVEEIIKELKETEDRLTQFFSPFSLKAQIEKRTLLKKQQLLTRRISNYFEAIGAPIEKADYGFALGKFHMTKMTIVQTKCGMIRENLLQLKQLLPFPVPIES